MTLRKEIFFRSCVCVCVCVCVFFFFQLQTDGFKCIIFRKKIIFPKKCPIWKYFLSKNSSDSQIGLGLRPRPILAVLGIFLSNYFQIGQHVVLLRIQIRPSIFALNPKPGQKYFDYTHRPKSRPNLK